MSKKLLYSANVISVLKKMRCKGVAEGVRGNGFVDPGKADRLVDRTLERALILMVSHNFARLRINRALAGKTYCQTISRLAFGYFRSSA